MENITNNDLMDLLSVIQDQIKKQKDMPEVFKLVELEKKINIELFNNLPY